MMSVDRIVIGLIQSAHGLEGALKIKSLTDLPLRFSVGSFVIIGDLPYKIVKKMGLSDSPILSLEGIDNRKAAEKLIGQEMCISVNQAEKPDENSFFQYELMGMEIISSSGENLGKVVAIERYPSCEALVLENGDEIPFLFDFISSLSREDKKVYLK